MRRSTLITYGWLVITELDNGLIQAEFLKYIELNAGVLFKRATKSTYKVCPSLSPWEGKETVDLNA